jgi:hypothetical protein
MKSSTTNSWATRCFDEHTAEPQLGRWQDFLDELHSSFKDKNLQRKAHEKLETFRQGTRQINEFFAIFDLLLNNAEVVLDDEKVWLIEHNIKVELIDAVYSSGVVPTTYITYRTHLLMRGRLWEQRQEQKALERRGLLLLAVWQRREEASHHQDPCHPDPQPTTDHVTLSPPLTM